MKSWHVRPVVDKTWTNFKLHFEAEHSGLRRVRGATMRTTSYHQANLLTSRVLNEVKEVKASVTEVLNMLSTGGSNDETCHHHLKTKLIQLLKMKDNARSSHF